ncbi:DUF6265 family protein [Brevundimonas balnearis]|uniref:DUF6265 family protein n=1 Tax=Brevundimonas balnearis TaxID=1572858 RepID=A0ABV6R447_9CAUL
MVWLALVVAQAAAPDLSWMDGYWLSCEGAREVAGIWTDDRVGQKLGMSVTVRGGSVSWEQARIGPYGNGLAFFAAPSGQAAAVFPMVEASEGRIVFESPDHDFPQRVIYSRDGARLVGRIEGQIEGQVRSAEWRYEAAALNARCPR